MNSLKVLKYFIKSEDNRNPYLAATDYHGSGGYLTGNLTTFFRYCLQSYVYKQFWWQIQIMYHPHIDFTWVLCMDWDMNDQKTRLYFWQLFLYSKNKLKHKRERKYPFTISLLYLYNFIFLFSFIFLNMNHCQK